LDWNCKLIIKINHGRAKIKSLDVQLDIGAKLEYCVMVDDR